MLKKNKNFNTQEKYLCFCSRVSHETFREHINTLYSKNLETMCNKLNIGKQCTACLPNVEDEFFNYKGVQVKNKKFNFHTSERSLKDRLKHKIDAIFGNELVSLDGHIPVIASKSIKTWLVVSNESPNLINFKIVPYKIELTFYNKVGEKINFIKHTVFPNKRYQICLNNYLKNSSSELESYYVFVKRYATKEGIRGSTRPHFFYEAPNSMASLHTQAGGRKNNFINLALQNKKDKNLLFIINSSKKVANINVTMQNKGMKIRDLNEFKIQPMGSKIIEFDYFKSKEKIASLVCKSSVKVKCYLIIANKKLSCLSVDHI